MIPALADLAAVDCRAAAFPAYKKPPMRAVPAIEIMEKTIVATEAVSTMRNFPNTMLIRPVGLHISVSMVPRSFSPAVRSMAGYMAPEKHRMMMIYGMKPPMVAPPTFSGGATFRRLSSNGFVSSGGRPRSLSRPSTRVARYFCMNPSSSRAPMPDLISPS